MEVSFDLTQRDLFAFSLYHALRRRMLWAVIFSIPVIVVLTRCLSGECSSFMSGFLYWLAMTLFFFFFYWIIVILSIVFRIRTKGYRALMVPQRLVITESGILAETERGRADINWSAIQKMASTRNLFMIYTTPVNALLFPRRVFGSDEEFREFMQQAKTFHREATEKTACQ